MEQQTIQDKINDLLSGPDRKIVFWYDDDASYSEDIDNLQLDDGSKIIKLTGNNYFSTKLLIEKQDLTYNFLVYAPFPRPEDKENPLADTFYYSEHFYSDRLIQMMGDLNIPTECQDEVKKYKKFWTSGNVVKFQALQIEDYTPESIDLGILCVLSGVKALSLEEIVRKVILAGISENTILKKIENQKIDHTFWQLVEKQYGYKDSNPTVEKFMASMLITYMNAELSGNIPKSWKSFVSSKQNDAIIFIKNMMNNDESKDFYDDFAEKAAIELDIKDSITQIPLDDVIECDALEEFDLNIINWIVAKLEDRMLDEQISGYSIPEICEKRIKVGYHFSRRFKNQYLMLKAAYHVLKEVSIRRYQEGIKEAIEDYVGGTYQIDTNYRKFYYYLDKVGLTENVEKVRDLVENTYTNKYLTDFTSKWNQSLTDEEYRTYTGNREEDFFEDFVEPFMHSDGGGRVIVIISDGMRYECARELYDDLQLDEKCNAKISHMLSVLPSGTTLGMAALLPNKNIEVSDGLDIVVDNMHCGNSMAEREKILRTKVKKSACYDFDVLLHAKQGEIRDMLQDKDLIYVYQNQIDNRGEGSKSENEVFNACQEAIKEIHKLIRRLTGYVSNTRYLITADHGFIYKRDRLPESDKISMEMIGVGYKNKRYLLSKQPINDGALMSRCLVYLSKFNSDYVTTPVGADIIKMAGGGQNYVHGGSSLQEMVVPVIKVNTLKGKQETGFVDVELSTFNHRVTSIVVKLDFMQMEPVTDTVKPRRLQAFFVDADNAKISFPVPITANIRSADAKDRLIQERFTLRSGKYNRDKDYYLVIADQDDETKELHRYKFEIDISDMAF